MTVLPLNVGNHDLTPVDLCDPQWFRDTASRGPTTIVASESQFRTCPSDHDSIGYPRMSASGESSTTIHRLLHASGSHPIPPPDNPKPKNLKISKSTKTGPISNIGPKTSRAARDRPEQNPRKKSAVTTSPEHHRAAAATTKNARGAKATHGRDKRDAPLDIVRQGWRSAGHDIAGASPGGGRHHEKRARRKGHARPRQARRSSRHRAPRVALSRPATIAPIARLAHDKRRDIARPGRRSRAASARPGAVHRTAGARCSRPPPSSPKSRLRRRPPPPPPPPPPLIDRTCSNQFFEENPSVLISSGLLVQADEGVSLPIVDLIDESTAVYFEEPVFL
ncbi:hypothetical protein F511_32987 [Dorcoceras hygrometricum]|uniref:Uncharacterized protein n=1 Tax=Dorcoceras hygrometricum TaxID=472368 RepID=A0A2Z7B0C6_9LAMI|nr:hypothetical protein F511_32987 [Dorcoceras hygrometricum]